MLAITNGRLFTITHGIIEGGHHPDRRARFVAVGGDLNVPADARVIDAGGCHVYPGLVDAHTHLGVYAEVSGPEGADGNEMTDPITPHVRALDSLDWFDPGFRRGGGQRRDDGKRPARQRQRHRRTGGGGQDLGAAAR